MQEPVKPLVTVLMPVYNAALFLREAMDSMLAQTLTNFEFLIINDGSKDDTVAIVESYNDPRINLVHNEENMGISATLNKGIKMAASDLIARMDADDISYPERLQKQYDFMAANPDCAMVSCYARVVSNNGEFIREEIHRDRFLYYTLTFECNVYHPAVMYRRQPVIDVNMYDIPYAEDYDLFWKLSSRFRIRQIEESLLDYRISNESTHLVHKKKEYDEAIFAVIRRNINHYLDKQIDIPEDYICFLRYEFEPLIKKRGFTGMVSCMYFLKHVSEKIALKANPNNINGNVWASYLNKRYYTLLFIKPHLSKIKWLLLCLLTGEIRIIKEMMAGRLEEE
ncbi:glycosyltransferase family 2 protein [Foetidibacter luteolus]|uniref:glycosyltransferase family 2 protein n=1 Tax=Foetidibacter luteolus TaxID=2608880 RepID=UPI00129BC40E|nr:glycosyltransferase family 2 protein [Foetidibacter luteolus]